MSGSYSHIQTGFGHFGRHRHTQRAALSPNVINAVKRLTSGYLFKSRHQTHSFFFFYLHRSQKLLSGEKGAFRSAQRPVRSTKQGRCFQADPHALFHHLQRERAALRRPPREQRRSLSAGQRTVEPEVAADSL